MTTAATQETKPLTFDALRAANVARLPLFKNRRGEPAHAQSDGSDWSLGEWCNAVLGELGEAANLIKKVHRGDLTLDEAREELAKEYADVVTYLDILAFQTGVNLGAATAAKWDEVSQRVGVGLRIGDFDPADKRLARAEAMVAACQLGWDYHDDDGTWRDRTTGEFQCLDEDLVRCMTAYGELTP